MSVLDPVILSEVREPIGTLRASLLDPGSKYLPMDGGVRLKADYPEFSSRLPTTLADTALTSAPTFVDATNSRPTEPLLDSISRAMFVNGDRLFVIDGTTLRIYEFGVLIATVTVDYGDWTQFAAYGNTLVCLAAGNRIGKSTDNGLTWSFAGSFGTSSLEYIRQSPNTFACNAAADTVVSIASTGIYTTIGNTVTFSLNPVNLPAFAQNSTYIRWRCVLWDDQLQRFVVGGAVYPSTSTISVVTFLTSSDGINWSLLYQHPCAYDTATTNWPNSMVRVGSDYHVAFSGGLAVLSADGLQYAISYRTSGVANVKLSDGVAQLTGTNNNISTAYPLNLIETKFDRVAMSDYVTLAIANGVMYGWGTINSSQPYVMGNSQSSGSFFPSKVGTDDDWAEVSRGLYASFAIKTNGTLWSTGTSTNLGILGLGLNTTRTNWTRVGSDSDWKQVSAGNNHTMAVKTDGSLWGWGANASGQLGLGNMVSPVGAPTRVGNGNDWAYVHAGYLCSFAIKTDGTLWACGSQITYQLGNGSSSTTGISSFVQIGTDNKWKKVVNCEGSSTSARCSAGIKTDGTIWAWGYNSTSQNFLGIPDGATKVTPTQIGTSADWVDIALTLRGGVACKSDGSLWTWGYSQYGEGGIGTTTTYNLSQPTKVGNITGVTSVRATSFHLGAITGNRNLYMWGMNTNSNLGFFGSASVNKFYPDQLFAVQDLTYQDYTAVYTTNRIWTLIGEELQLAPTSATFPTSYLGDYYLSLRTITGAGTVTKYDLRRGILFSGGLLMGSGTTRSAVVQRFGFFQYIPDITSSESVEFSEFLSATSTSALLGSGADDQYAYAVFGAHIYRSTDGASWTRCGFNPFVGSSNSGTVYGLVKWNGYWWLGGLYGVWKSSDLQIWDLVSEFETVSYVDFIASSSRLYAFNRLTSSSVTVRVTTDGISWTTGSLPQSNAVLATNGNGQWLQRSNTGLLYRLEGVLPTVNVSQQTNGPSSPIGVFYAAGRWIAYSATEIYWSVDVGVTWERANLAVANGGTPNFTAGTMGWAAGFFYVISSGHSVYVSSDGANWYRSGKPASIATSGFTKLLETPTGVAVAFDDTNNRIMRSSIGAYDSTEFVLPNMTDSNGNRFYVRVK